MDMFPISCCTPILTPQTQFQDRFGQPNAFIEMNPSLYISPDGEITVLVRRINYRKFKDRQFVLYEPKSISSYMILRGTMPAKDQPLSVSCTSLECLWSTPSYPTYWLGIEDVRFCDKNTILFACPEKNPSGQPCIFRGTLEGSKLHSIVRCEPSSVEKNWMPYELNGTYSVVYSLNPFQIKDLLTDIRTTVPMHESIAKGLDGYHGSTNGIVYKNDWRLFLIHRNKETTTHRWLLYNPVSSEIQYSRPFVFFQYSYIEFPCSLCEYNGMFYVSLGVNDMTAYILTIDPVQVESWFQES